MKAIITNQPSFEVTKIELLTEQTIFHLENGQILRVGMVPGKLQAMLNGLPDVAAIDLSQPPATQPDIFYYPFVARSVWDVIWPIVTTHREVRNAFSGHPNLEAVARLGYDELRQLPLDAYVSGPFGLYLHHPFNFVCRSADSTVPDGLNEYRCDFVEGSYCVRVIINMRTQFVDVHREHLP